ncbi:MAG: 23S rRNA (uracil(1939)-C(5))-methyltransferase RlmD [Bacteroidales bacterium]
MAKKRREKILFEQVEITDAGSEGKAIGRVNNRVIFVPFVVPGDIADIEAYPRRKAYFEGKAIKFHHYSDRRTEPRCEHFGICGGCRWQNMKYEHQLFYKQKQVEDNLTRIGKLQLPKISTILASPDIYHYRNKLEFTFSSRRWFTEPGRKDDLKHEDMNGLGFHIPGIFDRILDLRNCYLQPHPSNEIRLWIKEYADKNRLSFYDVRNHTGFLRNLIIRNTTTGQLMVILVAAFDDTETIDLMLSNLAMAFPSVTSLMYVINPKKNDIIADLPVRLFQGLPYITEEMDGLKFKIGPVSFFQTNPVQAQTLYNTARKFACLTGKELVYDLYTGTGTIANFIAHDVKQVVGMDYIPEAIADARENARMNGIENTVFYAGDIAKDINDAFISLHGKPDVVITDPPRAGMHPKVLEQLLAIAPEKIVYISCNPATQARDVAILSEKYDVEEIQPVDMFPHTQHVENVMLLRSRNG